MDMSAALCDASAYLGSQTAVRRYLITSRVKLLCLYLPAHPPESLIDRIFNYQEQHGSGFATAHDVGAGDGPYAAKLKARFAHVIVSDISASNVKLAKRRLGPDGYSYRQARVEDAGSVDDASVDLVFAANVMHFPGQGPAMTAIARQLRPRGTFAAAPRHFRRGRLRAGPL
ncbi:hypothetical protein N0V95_007734 [Ascochyta clinopodiicola]|nr:hypothetical protein N0V95_007734 [Ascochyta clinopodiicola]